jgi:triacylglycerol lipase
MHIKRHLLANAFCVLLLLDQTIDAKFTADFNRFLVERFGVGVAQQLERADLGDGGSFGGRAKAEQTIRQQPIVLVHGITNKIDRFSGIRQHFLDNGYTDAEIYGTTWGDAGKTGFMFVAMTCDFVKQVSLFCIIHPIKILSTLFQVRNLIVAVSMYTGQHVDVIAYSMGSPISRKAILGGNCVDTLENIGPPLTLIVDTFLGVAGANHGTFLCFVPFGSCNNVNGLHCTSRFLADINSR